MRQIDFRLFLTHLRRMASVADVVACRTQLGLSCLYRRVLLGQTLEPFASAVVAGI